MAGIGSRITWAAAFLLLVSAGIGLRLTGVGWGIGGDMYDAEPPYHPDELPIYIAATKLYQAPTALTFTWGGALYLRLIWTVDRLVDAPADDPFGRLRATMLWMRVQNIAFTAVTGVAVGWLAWQLAGPRAGFAAAAVIALAPGHVIESHYLRPDVLLVMLNALALTFAWRFGRRGRRADALAAALLGGLAGSTMSWGVAGLFALFIAWAVPMPGAAPVGAVRERLVLGAGCLLAGGAGYLLGSWESLYYWDAFSRGFQRAMLMHGGQIGWPTAKFGTLALYAYGGLVLLLGYAGMIVLAIQRWRSVLPLTGYLVACAVLLAMQGFDMMRYALIFAPVLAVGAGYGVECCYRQLRRPLATTMTAVVLLFTAQLSHGYVLTLDDPRDLRKRVADWIVDDAHRRGPNGALRIAVTRTFLGDLTYQPRFRPRDGLQLDQVMLNDRTDFSALLDGRYRYIVVSDHARRHASARARAFLAALDASPRYRRALTAGSAPYPYTLHRVLDLPLPDDLLYSRLTLDVYRLGP